MTQHTGAAAAALLLVATPASAQLVTPAAGGIEAAMPVESTDAAVEALSGVLKRGDTIAQHTVRAADAVVLQAAVKGKHRDIPAGVALARVDAEGGPFWCDVRPTSRWSFGSLDCLADTDRDGVLDRLMTGKSASTYFGLAVNRLFDEPKEERRAAAVRPAAPGERPTARIGYRYCEGDGVRGPPRFTTALSVFGGSWDFDLAQGCAFGEWPDPADKSLVQVDAIKVKVTPGADGLAYQVLDRIPVQQMGTLMTGLPFRKAQDVPTETAAAEAKAAEMSRSPMVATGPARVVTGARAKGDLVLSVPVRHGITGRLQNEVRPMGLFTMGQAPLPVGQPVYGVPMGGSGGANVVWCALRSNTDAKGRRKFNALCLPRDSMGHRWLSATPALMVTSLAYSQHTSAASVPTVAEGPVDFGVNLRLEYEFGAWRKNFADLGVFLRTDDGESQRVGTVWAPRLKDGSGAAFLVLGGALKLTPTPDGKGAVVEEWKPLQAEGRLPLQIL